MEIRKANKNDLDGFVELIRDPDRQQNSCICRDLLVSPKNKSMILDALANNVHKYSKLSVESDDDLYREYAESNERLLEMFRAAFEFNEEKEK